MAKNPQKKALARLGLTVENVLETCFTPAVKGMVSRNEFGMFWSQAADKKDATDFVAFLLGRLVSIPEASAASASASAPQPVVPTFALVNTLAFLVLFVEFDRTDSRIPKFLQTFAKQDKDSTGVRLQPIFLALKEAVRLLQLRVENGEMLNPIVLSSAQLLSPDEVKRLADPTAAATFQLADREVSGAEASFLYPYLRTVVSTNPPKRIKVLSDLLDKTVTLHQQLKMKPKIAETALFALLHMLKQFVCMAPLTDAALVKRALSTLQQFYLWREPFGSCTKDVLMLLKAESVTPGAGMRELFWAESRTGEVAGFNDSLGQKARPVHYFLNQEDDAALMFGHVLDLVAYESVVASDEKNQERVTHGSLDPPVMAMLVMNLLKTEIGLTDAEAALFWQLSDLQVEELYTQSMQILHDVDITKPAQAKERRGEELRRLKNELPARAAKNKGPTVKLPPANTLPAGFTPDLPPIAHFSHLLKLTYDFFAREDVERMCVSYCPSPSSGVTSRLEKILERYQSGARTPSGASSESLPSSSSFGSGADVLDVRIVIGGGNNLMHNFLCGLVSLMQSRPLLFKNINLKFFVLPLARNHIASFLSRHDPWFHRHVNAPFRTPLLLIPWVKAEKDAAHHTAPAKHDPTSEKVAPCKFYRSLVESYLREGLYPYPLCVYTCEGWNAGQAEKFIPDQAIPFLQRFEVGLIPDISDFQRRKGIVDMKLSDAMRHKDFDFNPPEIKAVFQRVDFNARPLNLVTEEPTQYMSILLSSIPRSGDPCVPPTPTDPWLEGFFQVHDNARAKQRSRKNVLLSDPKQHLNSLTLQCEKPDQAFYVRLDGHNFGPFTKVVVQPQLHPITKDPMIFPVQTFLPMDV